MVNFEQLNIGWNADPNVPDETVKILEADIMVQFCLNAYIYPAFTEGDKGILTFHKCLQYRLGPPNDEGFYLYGQSRYKEHGIKWGEFYLVKDSDWEKCFPDAIAVSNQSAKEMKHYLIYFRDETFECIAGSYDLSILRVR